MIGLGTVINTAAVVVGEYAARFADPHCGGNLECFVFSRN